MPGPLQREREHALVTRARAGFASRLDLAAVGNVAAELRGFFVVDGLDLVDAEGADTAPPEPPAATTTPLAVLAVAATLAG